MSGALHALLRLLYGRYVPEPVRNSLRLHLALLQRDREPRLAPAPRGRRVVVLAPHMDDEVFGCGGTLALAVAAQSRVSVVYLTDGSKGYRKDSLAGRPADEVAATEAVLIRTRKTEAQRAGAVLGLDAPVFLDLPDSALAATPEAVARLAATLSALEPEVVFLPFVTDIHHDHWLTNVVFVEAARAAGLHDTTECWGYEVWVPAPANTVVDVTTVLDLKRRAMAEFVSQQLEYDYRRAIEALNVYRSLFSDHGAGAAEAFYAADLGLYRRIYAEAVIGRARRPRRAAVDASPTAAGEAARAAASSRR
jgi:LmbE family N-acetylglucosaminyl deacetylase